MRGNPVPRERPAVAVRIEIERVVDRRAARREITCGLGGAGKNHLGVLRQDVVVPLGRQPEEGAVRQDGAAEGPSPEPEGTVGERPRVVGVVRQLVRVGEGAPERVHLPRTTLVEGAAGPVVRAAAVDHVEHAAAGAAHLGIVGVDLDLQFLDRLEHGDDDGAVPEVGGRDAVHGVVVAAERSAAQREQGRVRLVGLLHPHRVSGVDDVRRSDAEDEHVAARGGKHLELGAAHCRRHRRGRGLDQRRFADDGDRLLDAADVEGGVHHQERGNTHDEPFAHERRKAAEFGAQGVGARLYVREVVFADRVRDRGPRDAGALVLDRYGDAGKNAPIGVLNHATDAALERLGENPRRESQDAEHRGGPKQKRSHESLLRSYEFMSLTPKRAGSPRHLICEEPKRQVHAVDRGTLGDSDGFLQCHDGQRSGRSCGNRHGAS